MVSQSVFMPLQNKCFRGYTGISLYVLVSVGVSICTQNTSFCQSTYMGIKSHLVTALVLFAVGFNMLGGSFPVWALTLILGIALAMLVFCTSRNETQPKYHAVSIIILQLFLFFLHLFWKTMRENQQLLIKICSF